MTGGHRQLSVREVCETIWDAERELDLLDWDVRGVRVWQGLRFQVEQRLSLGAGAARPAGSGARALSRKLGLGLRLLRGSLGPNPFAGSSGCEVMVFESPRTTLVDGRRVCIYTDDLVRELDARGARLQLLELSGEGAHTKEPSARRVQLDGIEFLGALRGRVPISLERRDVERARELERFFLTRLGVALRLEARVASYVPEFCVLRGLYRRLFAKRRPRELYCVCSYGRLAPMIRAARDEGVRTSELQHGALSRYHLGYSFPVRPRSAQLEYLPDVFLSWGPSWNPPLDLPFAAERVVERGFPHFERARARYAGVAREPGSVLVLSQPVLGPKIAERLLESVDALSNRRIFYKLHPREYECHREYASLSRLAEQANVELFTDVDLYELMARAEVQIGVYSTAIYEGIQFGCKTVLLDLPGVEHVQDLIDAGRTEPFAAFVARIATGGAGSSAREQR